MVKKISQYKLVHDSASGLLEEMINKLIQKGWQPFGGVSHAKNNGLGEAYSFAQAMVKYDGESLGGESLNDKPAEKVECLKCGTKILSNTFLKTGGLCMPCRNGK